MFISTALILAAASVACYLKGRHDGFISGIKSGWYESRRKEGGNK